MKCVCKTQMMPPPDHKKEMKSNYLSFSHYQISDENQNPVDMHTSILCINILQNIKAVVPKLQEEIAEQTMYLYLDERTDRGKLICMPPPPSPGLEGRGLKNIEILLKREFQFLIIFRLVVQETMKQTMSSDYTLIVIVILSLTVMFYKTNHLMTSR